MAEINAYLNFDGNTGEVMKFYHKVLGGDLQIQTFGDVGEAGGAQPGMEDRIMHAFLKNGPLVLMASDTMPGQTYQQGNNVWLTLVCGSDDEVKKLHSALSAGGKDVMSPQDTFWGAHFGMCTDKYGINWMFNHSKGQNA
jgi:PhnB protein